MNWSGVISSVNKENVPFRSETRKTVYICLFISAQRNKDKSETNEIGYWWVVVFGNRVEKPVDGNRPIRDVGEVALLKIYIFSYKLDFSNRVIFHMFKHKYI